MIAMALANEPDILIADEPTTALDVTIQAQILELLKELQARLGMAILLITHDLDHRRRFAERVARDDPGRVVEQGAGGRALRPPAPPLHAPSPGGGAEGHGAGCRPERAGRHGRGDLKVYFPIVRGLLRRTVGHVKAVDGVIEVRAGQTVGVVGESGSGKTTLGLALLRLCASPGGIGFAGRRSKALLAGAAAVAA